MKTQYTGLVIAMTAAVLVAAVIYDIKYTRIPNWLTFAAMVLGILCHLYLSGIHGLLFSAAGLIIGTLVFMVFYILGAMGAGDVKLMGAIGTFLGPRDVLLTALYTGLAGGVYAIFLMIARKENREILSRYYLMAKTFLFTGHFVYVPQTEGTRPTSLRYGIAIAIGALALLAQRAI